MKFMKCEHCGNMIGFIEDKGVPLMCCGTKMMELIPGAIDGALEKHVPVVTQEGVCLTVEVGSVAHPMTPEHYIGWVAIETAQGNQRKPLKDSTKASFTLAQGDTFICAYAYCNLHGLWKSN